jgi:hypothetical protein
MVVNRVNRIAGRLIARFLVKPSRYYKPFAVSGSDALRSVLRPGDVLLVEGNQRISTAIKFLTQSTWSHAALYVGDALQGTAHDRGEPMLIEADLREGVIAVPISKYTTFNTRICRAVELSAQDQNRVVRFMISRIGYQYDLKNVIDLMRYFILIPPVPSKWRRRMLAMGSGDPTRAICSTLIAEAFQSIPYPILPVITQARIHSDNGYTMGEIMHIRHHSLYVPRDFDLSPYFRVIKPTIESGFNYKQLIWD